MITLTVFDWVWRQTASAAYSFLLGAALLAPLWKAIANEVKRRRAHDRAVEDLLDPHTPGGLGDLKVPLKR